LIQILKNIAKKTCYKVILDCDKKNLWFYKKCWFEEKNFMISYIFLTTSTKKKTFLENVKSIFQFQASIFDKKSHYMYN
jgi:hypothetical protein